MKNLTSAESVLDPAVLDVADFNERIIEAYNRGSAEQGLPADLGVARSMIPAGTAALRDFSYIAPEIPEFITANCVGCMECVTECPDTAILGTVVEPETLDQRLAEREDATDQQWLRDQFVKTTKYFTGPEKKGEPGGLFGIFIDPTKCKGCGECVDVCGEHNALRMIAKTPDNLQTYRSTFDFYRKLPETPARFIQEKVLADMMLAGRTLLYVGGAGSCMGCGEATALRMMLAATGYLYGRENIGVVASTGCNTVYASTYPYNPYLVPWTNSLFENGPADAMGVRGRWDQMGWTDKKLWVVGGDGAMLDIGFQSLSRMMASGMNINVLVLDTQVYSNTGGQTSTASFMGQDAKMSNFGREIHGKTEQRKELGLIAAMHPNVFVAQTTAAHINHFYRAIAAANEFEGPAVVNCYTTCQPEHGVGDAMASHQARLAVDARAFPLFIYDPRRGPRMRDRMNLQGNPAQKEDWYRNPKTGEVVDFISWARTEGRFARHFDADGQPTAALQLAQADRLANWNRLQEMAGLI